MNVEEYRAHDAVGLAQLVARREVTPDELLACALARMHAVNPKLNAVVQDLEGEARAQLAEGLPAGPLSGVPYLVKDITTQMKGVPTTAGSRLFEHNVAAADSGLVAAYRRAGLVMFGKTNTPEFALMSITEPALFGPALNPWNPGRTCGGSSGGAASAVAAGIVPAAQASDGGGSIRIPAACCGVFGLKPSRGRVSLAPLGEGWGGLTTLHAVTRSVRDSAGLLDASCGPVAGDLYSIAPPETPFLAEVGREPGRLRIGMLTTNLGGGAVDPEIVAAVREIGQLCETLGHSVEEASHPGEIGNLLPWAMTVIGAVIANMIDTECERRGRPLSQDEIERMTRHLYEGAKAQTSRQYVQAIQGLHAASRRAAAYQKGLDVLLLPTLGRLPIETGILEKHDYNLMALTEALYDYAPNTLLFNVAGQPAMSVPLAWSHDGLPIGIQFAAGVGQETLLFRLGGQLETARPWADKRPPEVG